MAPGEQMKSFFYKYFLKPIEARAGYNVVNTTVYTVLLVLVASLIYKALKRVGIKPDYEFLKAISPFIVFAALVRVLVDGAVYPHTVLTVTPGIFLVLFMITSMAIIFSKVLERHTVLSFFKSLFLMGSFLTISQIPFYRLRHDEALFYLLLYTLLAIVPFLLLARRVALFRNKLNKAVMLSHLLDASATHVMLTYYDYVEAHVFAHIWIERLGSLSFYLLKVIVLVPVLMILDKGKDREMSDYIKLIFFAFGAATGLRTCFRLVMGV
jgi:uncharacterized membrane protein